MPSMATGAKAMQTVSQRVISDAHLLDDALYEDESTEIATLLSSTVTSQKLDGLKRLIACISVGRDVSDFFPNVVVNVAHVPFEVLPAWWLWPGWGVDGADLARADGRVVGCRRAAHWPCHRRPFDTPFGRWVCGGGVGDPRYPSLMTNSAPPVVVPVAGFAGDESYSEVRGYAPVGLGTLGLGFGRAKGSAGWGLGEGGCVHLQRTVP